MPWLASSYQTSTSTRRFCARPASVAFDATGFVVAGPFVGDAFGRQAQRALQELGDFAGALARQTFVVAEDGRKRRRQRLGVGVADEMQPHVAAVAHAFQDVAQLGDRAVGNLGDTDGKVDRRHEVHELDGLELLGRDLAHLETVAGLRAQQARVVHPLRRLDLAGQVPLDGFAARGVAEELRVGRGTRQRGEQHVLDGSRIHSRFPLRRSRASVGSSRRQKTSGSMVSS